MGAKTQINAKDSHDKRPAWRCDACERDFLTLSALKSHTMAKHPEKYKQMQSTEAEPKEEKKTAFVPPTSRVSKRLQQKKSIDKEVITSQSNRKIVFECPKCLKEFGVFFPAHRHIQNRHCVDKDGNPVPYDSPDLIQPIRKEICMVCDKVHHGNESCDNAPNEESEIGMYCCLACKQVFQSVAVFDEHVEGHHDDSLGVVILENMNEFQNWKSNIEAKLHVKYLALSNTTQKQYYQCNYVSPQNSAIVTHLCPSVMIVREFSKGIHVRYHKDHYEHMCEKDTPPNNDTNIRDHDEIFENVVKSGVDIYTKLKDLMKSIALRAATLNRTKLKPLYISALQMQTYLNSLKGDGDDYPTPLKKHSSTINDTVIDDDSKNELENVEFKCTKVMTDDQIVKALEGTRTSNRLKRKSESSPVPEPKIKLLKSEPNTSLKENNSIDLACPERFESPKPNISISFNQSPSFNDSYKQFIDSTSSKVEKPEKSIKKVKTHQIPNKVKKEVVKTKIGQFTPSPKKTLQLKPDFDNLSSKKKKKAPVNTAPLKDLKLEGVKYEVVEQENDCNILILKI